jgi:hypothetical protein
MKAVRISVFIFILFIVNNIFAQDKDVYGPNNGIIKTSGSFHIEVVPDEIIDTYKVFLLDLNNKNPTVKDSSVELQLKESNKMINFYCSPMGVVHFHCASKKITVETQKNSRLVIKAKRLGVKGQKIIYKLPLKLKDKNE